MITSLRFACSAALAIGVLSLSTAVPAGAQRHPPRMGVAAPPPQTSLPRIGFPSTTIPTTTIPTTTNGVVDFRRPIDPRFRQNDGFANRRFHQQFRGSSVVYVPYPVGGYYDGYYGSYGAGQVYDANGRPLAATFESMSSESMPPSVSYGYTPDLSGSPYSITEEGMMAVDFANGERRAFPACAAQGDLRDPQGRPRTIFYHETDYWMILKPGQRGRVQGEPAANAKACYAIDSAGRVVLRQ
jgi:hypothetical protein